MQTITVWEVMGIFGWLLQLKYTSTNASPFVTHYVTMLMFIIAFFVYFGFLTVKIRVHAPNPDMREFINNMTFLFGTMASILLLLILVRAYGLFALLLWTIYVARDLATKKSYRIAVCDVFNRVKEMIKSYRMAVCDVFNRVKEMTNGNLVETNAIQPQPPPHIVVQIQDTGEPNVL
ncbi:hypothetical protein ACLB2K_006311 [Fragaria x ananassa]